MSNLQVCIPWNRLSNFVFLRQLLPERAAMMCYTSSVKPYLLDSKKHAMKYIRTHGRDGHSPRVIKIEITR